MDLELRMKKFVHEYPSNLSHEIFKKYCTFDEEEVKAVISKWTNSNLWDGVPNWGGSLKYTVS